MITLTRTQLALVAVPLLALLAVAGSRLAGVGANEGPSAVPPLARMDAEASEAAPRLFVYVVGAVRRPGLFRLKEGARVADALGRAGGPTRGADLTARQPRCSARGRAAGDRAPPWAVRRRRRAARSAPGAKVSLATATVEQLDELPGIGPVTAQKIVDWRTTHGPFRSVEDLDDVPGIGPARIEQLRDLVTP